MAKIIIGIHGLGNKVPKDLLERWWKAAIREGLKASGHSRWFFDFEMVYWAHLLHPRPLNPALSDEKDPHYVDAPYLPRVRLIQKPPSEKRIKILNFIDKRLNKLFLNEDMSLNFSAITDMIIHRYFKDLEIYYSSTCILQNNVNRLVKEVIRDQLAQVLIKHRKKQILLVAHSMGSIIAYDVLSLLRDDINIDTLITIGSPLGLPIIRSKILSDQRNQLPVNQKTATPPNISRHWFNFADLEDKVAISYSLGEDYEESPTHVRVVDKVIYNDYSFNGHRNPHKDYGYLRTPEIGQVFYDFLTFKQRQWRIRLTDRLNRWFLQKLENI